MAPTEFDTMPEGATALDAADELAPFRSKFELPQHEGRDAAYLCGHSLGLMPRAARAAVARELDAWGTRGVDAHFGHDGGWYAFHERFAAPLANLLGVEPASVVAMNSLTVNLHLMLVSFFRPKGERRKILIEQSAFPSDRYAAQSQLRWHGLDPTQDLIELEGIGRDGILSPDDLERALHDHAGQIALVLLPGVQFLTGQALDAAAFANVARRHGAAIGLDLAHAIGNLPACLANADVDFAVWCSYKYLNGGPGAIGGCYVHPRWHTAVLPRFEGWWGHDKQRRFELEAEFDGIASAEAWQLSNPPILAMAPLEASLALFADAGLDRLHRKSRTQHAYLRHLLDVFCGEHLEWLTPMHDHGCQVSIRIRTGDAALVRKLAAAGVVADWRQPDVLRLAPVPLYNSYEDIFRAAIAIRRALDA